MDELQRISDLLQEVSRKLDDLPANIKLSAKQVFATNLAQITNNAGVLTAGEFRVGNGKEPGSGFTGVRMSYPPMTYSGSEYPFASVNNDVLQVGISLSNGKLYAGEGAVFFDVNGITLNSGSAQTNTIKFNYNYPTDNINVFGIYSVGDGTYADVYFTAKSDDATYMELIAKSNGNALATFSLSGQSGVSGYAQLTADTEIILASPKITLTGGYLLVGGDGTGVSGYVGLTNVTSGVSTGNGIVLMNGTTARDSTGWLKIMDGTTAKYIPFWTTITG